MKEIKNNRECRYSLYFSSNSYYVFVLFLFCFVMVFPCWAWSPLVFRQAIQHWADPQLVNCRSSEPTSQLWEDIFRSLRPCCGLNAVHEDSCIWVSGPQLMNPSQKGGGVLEEAGHKGWPRSFTAHPHFLSTLFLMVNTVWLDAKHFLKALLKQSAGITTSPPRCFLSGTLLDHK